MDTVVSLLIGLGLLVAVVLLVVLLLWSPAASDGTEPKPREDPSRGDR